MGSRLRVFFDAVTRAPDGRRRAGPVAVRHPLGFVCLPLRRLTDLGVCLHVWTTRVQPARLTTSPVHCHSWDLVSLVLYGSVRNNRVHVWETTDTPTHRLFDVHSRGEVDEIRATDSLVRCRPGDSELSRPGEVYRLPAGEFHHTVVPAPEAATLVVGWSRPGMTDRSVGPMDVTTHRERRSYCDAAEAARAVRIVAERLADVGAHSLVEVLEERRETVI
jgi:hypothetical protein